jgi:hypothetical protein
LVTHRSTVLGFTRTASASLSGVSPRSSRSARSLSFRPARKDEKPRYFPNRLRQRIEAIIWTVKHQPGLERHGGRVPAGLWARMVQRLLALNAAIWFNWQIGAPVKRSLIAYDHGAAPNPRSRSRRATGHWVHSIA